MQVSPYLLLGKSTSQHGPAIDINDLTRDKTRIIRAQEQHHRRNFLWLSRSTQRNRAVNALADHGVPQRRCGHIRFHPAWGHAIHIDAIASQLGGKPFYHADHGAFAGGIIAMESFTTLAGRRADQHHMAAISLLLHLRHAVFYQTKITVEVDGQRGTPLLVGHLVDWRVMRRPDAVVSHHDIASSKLFYRLGHQRSRGFTGGKLRLHRYTFLRSSTFQCQTVRVRTGLVVIEKHSRASGSKHAHDSGANAARATCYNSYSTLN